MRSTSSLHLLDGSIPSLKCASDFSLQADEPLGTFMDYCTYGFMIDNIVLIVTGTLHERNVQVSSFTQKCCISASNH